MSRAAAVLFGVLALAACAPLPGRLLADRQRAALARGDWLEAVRLGHARVAAAPLGVGAHYDLGCALARAGDGEAAMAELQAAVALGLEDPGQLARDEDLVSLRRRPDFAALLAEGARVEREGVHVEGTRVLVRADLPMPLRLRLPLDGRRLGLVVWLHPSGALLNARVERLAPRLLARGWALAVPISPRPQGWNDGELTELLDQGVPRLEDVVDVQRPLLLGFSAGAQAALVAWAVTPERFAKVVAIGPPTGLGGYPVPGPGAAPVELVLGGEEHVRAQWGMLIEAWRGRGVPLSAVVVPGRGHELLVDEPGLLEEVVPVR